MLNVDIISDTVCPWCYIGKRRLERALEARPDIRIQATWRPFQLNPQMPDAGMSRAQFMSLKFGGENRANRIFENIRSAGQDEGLDFQFEKILHQPNTLASHRVIRWAGSATVQDRLVEVLFAKYFFHGADIGNHQVLVEAAGEAAMDADLVADLLAKGADEELIVKEEAIARRMGIAGVPCFIVEGKYAVSGAQDPSVLINVFDLALKDQENESKQSFEA